MQLLKITMTTDGAGAGTAYATDLNGNVTGVRGRVVSVQYVKGDFDNGSTMTLSAVTAGLTIWSEAAVNASTIRFPRQQAHSAAGVGITWYEPMPLAGDRLLMTVSAGGATKTATWYVGVE